MPRPGTDVYIVDDFAPGGPSLDTGQAFFGGIASRGPVDRCMQIKSMRDYREHYGDRTGGSLLYDSVGAFFSEGGATMHVQRVAGAGIAAGEVAFGDLLAVGASPGAWTNDLSVAAVAPAVGSGIVIEIKLDGVVVARSPAVTTLDQANAWAFDSPYVHLDITDPLGALPPAATSVDLVGGADGAAADVDDLVAALAKFDYALGPGQVALPGYTSLDAHMALLAHASACKRCALLDLDDSDDPLDYATSVNSLEGIEGVRFAGAFGPWVEYPAETSPATVLIPYSGMQAGLIARSDALGNPNQPAAGAYGVSRTALGLSQTFTDAERESLNDIGVTLGKVIYGDVRTYGGRTAAGPAETNWLWLGGSRTVLAIAHNADAIAEGYVLRQIDGRRQLFAAFESDLRGMLLGFFQTGSLYGATPEEAFAVDTGEGINTIETIAAGEVHAAIYVKTSPAAEWVRVDIVKVPIERALPTAA